MKARFTYCLSRTTGIVLSVGVLLFIGCTKQADEGPQIAPEDLAYLNLHVTGITEPIDQNARLQPDARAAASSAGENSADLPIAATIEQHDGFDAITTLAPSQSSERLLNVSGRRSSESSPTASVGTLMASAMPEGRKYRLLLYTLDGTTETFWRSVELTARSINDDAGVIETERVEVIKGATYTWYAFSYNSTDPVADVSNYDIPQISTGENRDLLYDSGQVTIGGTPGSGEPVNQPLAILFERKTARVAVELDARGLFTDNVSVLTANVSFPENALMAGTLDLRSDNIADTYQYAQTVPVTISDFSNVDAGYNDRKVAYFHSATDGTISSLNVNLTALTVQESHDGGNRAHTGLNSNFSFANVPLQIGSSRTAKIDLLESPLVVPGSTTRWARENLFFAGDDIRNPYRFRRQNSGRHHLVYSDLFMFRDSRPAEERRSLLSGLLSNFGSIFGSVRDDIDPCGLVYPSGAWTKPTRAQLEHLASAATATNNNEYIEFQSHASNIGTPYASNQLRLYKNEWHQFVLIGLGLLHQSRGTNNAFYWSTTHEGSLITGSYYHFYSAASGGSRNVTTTGVDLSLPILGTIATTRPFHFASIRCVRTEAYSTPPSGS